MKPYPSSVQKVLLIALIHTLLGCSTQKEETVSQRFRGPDGSGNYSAPDLPVQWTEKDYLWTVELPGDGQSSPMAWKDHLYISSSDAGKPRPILLCLNSETGNEIWRKEFQSEEHQLHRNNSFSSSTTAVDQDHVYFVWSDHSHFQIAAIDHDGTEVWRRNLGTNVTQHGGGTSPIIYKNLVFVQNDCRGPSSIHALNRMTGETVWSKDRPWDAKGKTSYSTPLLFQPETGDPYIIFNSTSSGMTAIVPETGDILWQLPDLFPKRTIMSPIRVSDLVFSSCGDGNAGFYLVAVRPPKTTEGEAEIAYTIRKSAPYVPTPVAKGNLLFLVSDGGIATCIEAATGKEIWKEKLGDTYFSSPICVDDRIYAVSRRADVVVFKASDQFEQLGRTLINQSTNATPIVDNGRLYLRTESHLYCLEGNG